MGIVSAQCDDCGGIIIGEIHEDYNNYIRCTRCYLEYEIKDRQRMFSEKKKWLEDVHVKELTKLHKEISVLKEKLAEVKLEGNSNRVEAEEAAVEPSCGGPKWDSCSDNQFDAGNPECQECRAEAFFALSEK